MSEIVNSIDPILYTRTILLANWWPVEPVVL